MLAISLPWKHDQEQIKSKVSGSSGSSSKILYVYRLDPKESVYILQ